MKTTKKGFTLIELIVVIAIIGVLAAILVPSMLGYVRKSKISSANSTASSIFKAINSALTELDEEGFDVGGDAWIKIAPTTGTCTTSEGEGAGNKFGTDTDAKLTGKIKNFFSDITKVKGGAIAYCTGGSCGGVAVAVDSTYVGTFPSGVVTSDTYETYKGKDKVGDAIAKALEKNGITKTNGTKPSL